MIYVYGYFSLGLLISMVFWVESKVTDPGVRHSLTLYLSIIVLWPWALWVALKEIKI